MVIRFFICRPYMRKLIFFIIFCESAFLSCAFALSPKEISLSEKLGFVVQTYESPAITGSGKKVIIHIQDLHVHYEAQKNLANILEKLVNDYKLNLILVEGGWGDVSLSYLRDYGSKEKRLEVAEKYLKSGEISGEEYLDIISDYKLKLQGIENENLYNAHIKAFLEVEKFQSQAKAYLSGLAEVAEGLKGHIYSRSLQEFNQIQKAKDENKINLADYCAALADKARYAGISPDERQDFNNFTELARLEKKNPLAYYSALDELAKKNLPDYTQSVWSARTYANINTYLKYLRASEGIDLGRLSSQMQAITVKIKEKLFVNEDEKKLSEISDNLKLLGNLVSLKLSPEEHTAYLNKKSTLSLKDDVDFLKENAIKYAIGDTSLREVSPITVENFATLDNFYKIAEERNIVFMQNIISAMEDNGEDIACLITGGFHTPFIIEQLKQKGVSYCVVAPRITEAADDAQYVKILKEKAGIK